MAKKTAKKTARSRELRARAPKKKVKKKASAIETAQPPLPTMRLKKKKIPRFGSIGTYQRPTPAANAETEWVFKAGVKYGPDGKRATPVKCKETPASNGLMRYLTILWSDGVLSCDCRGWAIKKPGKPRDCKHCKASRSAGHNDMAAVADFVPATNAPRTQITFGERQLRRIRIRSKSQEDDA